jgi:hypothetical protein
VSVAVNRPEGGLGDSEQATVVLAVPALALGVLGAAGTASATTTAQTVTGTVKSGLAGGGGVRRTVDCGAGYVESESGFFDGDGITSSVRYSAWGGQTFFIADRTVPWIIPAVALVKSVTIHIEAPFSFTPITYTATVYRTDNQLEAWEVLAAGG